MTRARDLSEIVNSTGLSVDTDTLVVDSANNRVGIGTDSPGYSLQVQETSPIIAVQSTGVNTSRLLLSAENDAVYIGTTYGGSNIPIIFSRGGTSSGAASMTIDSVGNVGIGVVPTAAYKMQVNVATNTVSTGSPVDSSLFNIAGGTTTVGDGVSLQLSNVSGAKETGWRISAVTTSGNNGDLVFNGYAGGADYPERMRIDGAGNLLVGQTTNAETGTGIGFVPDGTSHMYSANTDALMLGRGGSDGDILSFNRSGAPVGSIGSYLGSGTSQFFIAGADTGFKFNSTVDVIAPSDSIGGTRDAAIDLGDANARFKDLYLSGSVVHTFDVINNGTTDYQFSDAGSNWFPTAENDPILYLRRGETYIFSVVATNHPFNIRVSNGGAAYTTGVTNNGAENGDVVFKVPMSAPATLYYQCANHSAMGNTINIV